MRLSSAPGYHACDVCGQTKRWGLVRHLPARAALRLFGLLVRRARPSMLRVWCKVCGHAQDFRPGTVTVVYADVDV